MPMNPRLLRPLATGFNPRSISGLAAWWDSTDNSTITTDTGVSAWVDKVNGYTLAQSTGANQPTLSSINGKQAFSYNGSSQFLSSTTSALVALGTAVSAVKPTTIFYVLRLNATATTVPVGWASSTSFNPVYAAIHAMNTGLWRTFYRDDAGGFITTSSTASYATSTNYVLSTKTAGTIVGRVNGQQVISTSNTSSSAALTATQFAVGALLRDTASLYVNGLIGDVLIYNRVLTLAETQNIERGLAGKFGVALA
jgi:hypothetical protein